MVFLYGNAVRVRNRLDSTGQIWAAARPRFGFTNISLILQRYFNLYIVPIISDSRGVNLSIWLQILVSVLQSFYIGSLYLECACHIKNVDILGGTPTWDLDVPVHPIVANHAGWPSLTET